MSAKTRYLQLSDVIMLEYELLGINDVSPYRQAEHFIWTKLKNGHYCYISPLNCEVTSPSYDASTHTSIESTKKNNDDIISVNTLQHLSVPKEKSDSFWYTFLDPDYVFNDIDVLNGIGYYDGSNLKYKEYAKYCTNPSDPTKENPFEYKEIAEPIRWDTMKLYFVNGYDFSNINGIYARVSVDRFATETESESVLDLCSLFFNKASIFSLIKFMSKPIIFGNNIYDRYLEINLPCLYDIMNSQRIDGINSILNVGHNSSVKLNFAYILDDNVKVEQISYTIPQQIRDKIINTYTNCTYIKDSALKGTIPIEKINSDNLGLFIAENPDSPYIEFYGTWNGNPLNFETVQSFNRTIKLYNTDFVRSVGATYEVDDDYMAHTVLEKWVAMHEIKCSFMGPGPEGQNIVLKTDSYIMSQLFTDNRVSNNSLKFYYRPVVFDEGLINSVNNIVVDYTMRFINVMDRVQFTKAGSLVINDVSRFYAKGSKLNVVDITPYKVYNKIVENKQVMGSATGTGIKTKYVKVFYDSTNVLLDNTNGGYYASGDYTLKLSTVSKNYKFIIRKRINSTKSDYFDLTDGYYKLYVKDENNVPVILEPTYSTNMNLALGEIEFTISTALINKLMNVDEDNRKMSIVAYNDDNSVSSLYDFKYTF